MTKRSEGREAREGREGFGDDQGTRVGSPTPGKGVGSDGRVSEEIRASGREGSGGSGGSGREAKQTGAGAEAAEGVHTSEDRTPDDRTGLEDVDTGRSRFDEATVQRAGSEPITREREHKSGYGGEGGTPKESSDKREPREPEGKAR